VRDFDDEVGVLSRWLGRDIASALSGAVPEWTAFRFRDATAFEPEASDGADRMYLVRGQFVREFVVSQTSIDEAYAQLTADGPVPAIA